MGTVHRMRVAGALWVLLASLGVAHAVGDEHLELARSLFAKAEPLAAQGDDPDIEDAERKAGRKEARTLLKQARDEYNAWQNENPGKDDQVGVEIGKLLYWVNKMSSIGEVTGGGSKPAPSPTPAVPPASPPAGGSGANPSPGATPAAPPPDPGQQAKDDYAALTAFADANKADIPALKDAFEKFLADHPDPSLPEYTKAALRLGQLTEDLNATFKKVVGRDPEALDNNADSAATPIVMLRLKRDLAGKEPELRRNAAKLLGMTRSGAASYALAGVLRDSDAEVARLAAESLVQIGGWRTAETLTKQYRERSGDSQAVALGVIEQIAKKGSVDAKSVSFWIGRFVLSNDGEIAGRALESLTKLGPDGGPGLVEAMESRMDDKRLQVIDAIGRVNYVPGAARLSALLLRGDGSQVQNLRGKSMDVIKGMGIPAIPYLFPALADARTRQWTGYLLQQMTGERISSADIGAWKAWYARHKNDKR
ncbi:MAG: HEAT repeat domain-containing protein [Planctomycetes bacterium]|nr:HEAT repeat domain-containing protein [Planctomycetota bacterium]